MKVKTPNFLKPVKIIPQIWSLFGIYILIGIGVGQLGILYSFLTCVTHKDVKFINILNNNLSAGNFYTFSISLIASAVVPFLIEYLGSETIRFKHYKVITSILMFVVLILPMSFFFSDIVNSMSTIQPEDACSIATPKVSDKLQIFFYVATIAMCTYAFCVSYLHLDYESYAEIDNAKLAKLKSHVPQSGAHDSRKNKV
jgi:MFS family permease